MTCPKLSLFSATALALLISVPMGFQSWAGWHSSGGESFHLENNPWFVKNTHTVNYCVRVDESTVTAPASEVRDAVAFALDYWKHELALSSSAPKGFTPIATQDFVYQQTCAGVDITFKIGYGTLDDPKEIEYLVDPTLYIGVGIRKEYDEVNMKGSGIIYISSDKGPHSYRNSGNLVTEAWRKPNLLKYALLHEVGHIMGLAHVGVGIMSETFLTNVLNKDGWTFYADQPILSFTRPLSVAEVCIPNMNDSFEPSYFGLDSSQKCLRLEMTGRSDQWTVSSRADKNASLQQVGQLSITNSSNAPLSQKPVIFVYLPDKQSVFQKTDLGFADYLIGAVTQSGIYQGVFTRVGSHKPYRVQIGVDPESLIVSGVVNDQIVPVFNHTIPSLKGILFPLNVRYPVPFSEATH